MSMGCSATPPADPISGGEVKRHPGELRRNQRARSRISAAIPLNNLNYPHYPGPRFATFTRLQPHHGLQPLAQARIEELGCATSLHVVEAPDVVRGHVERDAWRLLCPAAVAVPIDVHPYCEPQRQPDRAGLLYE